MVRSLPEFDPEVGGCTLTDEPERDVRVVSKILDMGFSWELKRSSDEKVERFTGPLVRRFTSRTVGVLIGTEGESTG